jgi:YD repeat-containing protein
MEKVRRCLQSMLVAEILIPPAGSSSVASSEAALMSGTRSHGVGFVLAFVGLVAGGCRASAADEPVAEKPAATVRNVFAAPQADLALRGVLQEVLAHAAAGRLDDARDRLEAAIIAAEIPPGVGHYNLACLHCATNDTDAALVALAEAIEAGFDDVVTLANDPDLRPLRGLPQFDELGRTVLDRARAAQQTRKEQGRLPKPRPVQDGVAEVAEDNTQWIPQLGRFLVAHEFAPATPDAEITTQPGPVGDLLRQWREEGTAAGLDGVLYDNHDEGHSVMNRDWFPELTSVTYSTAAKRARTDMYGLGELHRGLQVMFLHNAPVIGNASVAQTQGPFWRSMPRLALANAVTATMLADQYTNNMLYFYPEHRDHDPESDGGHGDVYPANIPYLITSQGSSGSDRAFMNAVAATLAAFRPETRTFLVEKRLLMPTVQLIFRSCRKPVTGRDDYLSGRAHPPVFDGATLDVERMVRMAHDMEPADVPPLVRLTVEEEYLGRPGIDYFEVGPGEKLFDTVSAVARVARSSRERRRMVASVAATEDPGGQPLSFVWRLLHGDPERVQIQPLDPLGTRAEILVDWHPRGVYPGSDLPSARVDVGVFADNGSRLSASAFLSWYFPPNERRIYEDVPATARAERQDEVNGDAPRRIVSIERLPASERATYADPMILTPADWTDAYRYDEAGNLLGWTRSRADGTTDAFIAAGQRIVKKAEAGQPAETRSVRYVREQKGPNAWPVLREKIGN